MSARLRRAALILLGVDSAAEDARDWAGLEADNDALVEQVRALEEQVAMWKTGAEEAKREMVEAVQLSAQLRGEATAAEHLKRALVQELDAFRLRVLICLPPVAR